MHRLGATLTFLVLTACSGSDVLDGSPVDSSGDTSGSTRADGGVATGVRRDAGTGGASGQSTGAGSADGKVCDVLNISTGRVTPDMLIVLDRSSSMRGAGIDRWAPSVRGVKSITAALDSAIQFGLMVFPGMSSTGFGGGECVAGTVEVPVGPRTSTAIATRLDTVQLVGTTPTAVTLAAAHRELGDNVTAPDGVAVGAPYVVLVTDGAPNCTAGAQGGRGGANDEAVAASVREIELMAAAGIKTYVLGYDTQHDLQLKSALDRMAQAGGTGDTVHRAIEDEAGLVAAFRAITGRALSCDVQLDAAPADPSYVSVTLAGKALRYGDADGWTLSADKRTLSLQGAACQLVQQDTAARLSVQVQCERVQVI